MESNAKEMILKDALSVAIESKKKIIWYQRALIVSGITIIGLLMIIFFK